MLFLSAGALAETVDLYIGSTAPGPDGGIYLASLDETTGALSEPKKIVEFPGAGFQDLSPDGKFLLSTSKADGKPSGQITLFSIGDDLSLTSLGNASAMGEGTCHVSFDRSGKVAMFANYGSGSVGSALIGDDGSFADSTFGKTASYFEHEGKSVNPKRQNAPHAHSIYPGPDNKFAYAPDLGTDRVEIYKIDTTTGKLSHAGHAKTPPGAGPRHLKFSKDSKQVFVLNELTTSISVFNRLPDGMLEKIQDISTLPEEPVLEGMTCSEIRVHPNGRFVFTANRDTQGKGNDSLSVFELKDGKLERLSTVPAEVSIPRNINLSPSGKWLITGGQKSYDIAIFSVDSETGALKKVGDNIPCPGPMCYVFLP
ncbi:lactonase family protein [Haloferula sp.]|uniref:lactonase family protein n=1 Tax=Haloferula sp. TaxID=2497595 RepID=UPI003C7749F6